MRLYLTSYRMGHDADRLLAMVGSDARVIQNALDLISEQERRAYAARTTFRVHDWFGSRGLRVVDLDLRDYFSDPRSVGHALDAIDLLWATGGNAFLLLRAIRQSGLEVPLKHRLDENSIVYGGWSAGACVAGATLKGVHLMDEPYAVADGYDPDPEWEGMNLVDYTVIPHFESEHPEAKAAGTATEWLKARRIPFRALRDGESIIVDDLADGRPKRTLA